MLALLAASATAFAVAQRFKLQRAPVTQPRFTRVFGPMCGCDKATARLSVRLRRAESLGAAIVTMDGDHVRTLATGLEQPPGRVQFTWDGRDDAGKIVAEGRYRLRLRLERAGRTIIVPTPVRVDTTPPRVELIAVKPRVISPDEDGRADRARYTYRSSEFGYPVVYVNGEYTARGRHWPAGVGKAQWRARAGGGTFLPAGIYRTRLAVVDVAGNSSEPTEEVVVRIRLIDLAERRLVARRGGRITIHVDVDAKSVSWAIGAANRFLPLVRGTAPAGAITIDLPRRLRPGRYLLRAWYGGRVFPGEQSDRLTLAVLPR